MKAKSRMNRRIIRILIEGQGWEYSEAEGEPEIEEIEKNGERWFRQGCYEFNGRYVVMVVYDEEVA